MECQKSSPAQILVNKLHNNNIMFIYIYPHPGFLYNKKYNKFHQ